MSSVCLVAINVPTLILNGDKESKAVYRHSEEMLKLIPQSEAYVIPAAGQTSNMEDPVAFNAHLDVFLTKIVVHKI